MSLLLSICSHQIPKYISFKKLHLIISQVKNVSSTKNLNGFLRPFISSPFLSASLPYLRLPTGYFSVCVLICVSWILHLLPSPLELYTSIFLCLQIQLYPNSAVLPVPTLRFSSQMSLITPIHTLHAVSLALLRWCCNLWCINTMKYYKDILNDN